MRAAEGLLPNYTGTTLFKHYTGLGAASLALTTDQWVNAGGGTRASAAAITPRHDLPRSGNLIAESRLTIYELL